MWLPENPDPLQLPTTFYTHLFTLPGHLALEGRCFRECKSLSAVCHTLGAIEDLGRRGVWQWLVGREALRLVTVSYTDQINHPVILSLDTVGTDLPAGCLALLNYLREVRYIVVCGM